MTKHISMFPLFGIAHLYPILELCSLLVTRGNKVTCVVEERAAGIVAKVGAEPITFKLREWKIPEVPEDLYGFPHDPRWWDYVGSIGFPSLLTLATDTLSQVADKYSQDAPDLVVYDREAYAGRVFASSVGATAVQMYPHFANFSDYIYRERGICFNPPQVLSFAERLDDYLWKQGIKTNRNLWHNEALNIYFLPEAFQHHPGQFDERFCFVGACLKRPYKRCWTPPDGDKPIILISDSSVGYRTQQYFSPFIDALSGLNCHVILSIGDAAFQQHSLPENFEVNRFASHLEILPHASLAIALGGGVGTVLEALYNGVPVLISPRTPPAAEVAYRVSELGVGVSFPHTELTVDVIRWVVEGLLSDPAIRSNVMHARDLFRQSGGATLAADRIESLL